MDDQVFFNVLLAKLEPIFKRWIREAQADLPNKEVEPNDKQEDLLTVQGASSFLSLTVPTIYSKVSKGELPFMKRSKRLYFSRTELIEYLRGGRRKTNEEISQEADQYLTKGGGGAK